MWSEKKHFQSEQIHGNLNWIRAVIIAGFILLAFRVFFISVVKSSHFQKMSEDNSVEIFDDPAPRGIMYDCMDRVIVDNRMSFLILFSPINLTPQVAESTYKKLSDILKKKPAGAEKIMGNVEFDDDVAMDVIYYLSEQKHNLPGMRIQLYPRRHYPYGAFAAHLLGYLSEISKSELRNDIFTGYRQGDIIGKTGIEKMFDPELRGRDGSEQIEVDVEGRPVKMLLHQPSQMGNSLFLTINNDIQDVCERAMEGKKGAVCVLDPRSGRIVAMTSSPDFDPNMFSSRKSGQDYKNLAKDKSLPLFNRAMQCEQSPGSTFKIITAIAALESGAIDEKTTFSCRGSFSLGRGARSRVFKCWEEKGHGKKEIIGAISHSCDVFFYQAGLKTGVENISKYAVLFGLSEKSGIDLPSEKPGLIPSSRWKHERYHDSWYPGDTVNMSIGQGYILVTPIQMANLMCMVANKGVLYKPFFVRRIAGNDGRTLKTYEPKVIRKVTLNPRTWEILQKGLRSAVVEGTCRAVNFSDLTVAAKTGTAQNPHGTDHAWFVCYAPFEDPQICIAVFIEHGGHGASGAAPIARKVLETYFHLQQQRAKEAYVETFIAGD